MTSYQILYWHNIPLQVRVLGEQRRDRITQPLAPRFQIAIDQAAMAAGVTADDAYTEGFRWSEPQARTGTTEEVLNAVVAEIEAQYAVIDWRATAARLKSDQSAEADDADDDAAVTGVDYTQTECAHVNNNAGKISGDQFYMIDIASPS